MQTAVHTRARKPVLFDILWGACRVAGESLEVVAILLLSLSLGRLLRREL
jgi:hypothetical protein